jgi:hypothetical protein
MRKWLRFYAVHIFSLVIGPPKVTWWFVKQEHSYCDQATMWCVKFLTKENKIWCLWTFCKESAFSIITSKWSYLTAYSFNITFSSNCQFYLQFHCTAAKINEPIFHISLSCFCTLFFIMYMVCSWHTTARQVYRPRPTYLS